MTLVPHRKKTPTHTGLTLSVPATHSDSTAVTAHASDVAHQSTSAPLDVAYPSITPEFVGTCYLYSTK